MSGKAFQPITLPNGTRLKNRIAKAAMEEKLADVAKHNQPSQSLIRLYKTWGEGGAGLLLSGHVMIDPTAMGASGDILLAEDAGLFDERLWKEWIDATQQEGAQFWLQINHPGRQIMKGTDLPTYAPSAVPMEMGALTNMFDVPREMTEDHIEDVIRRFVWAAKKAEQLGAAGVEIHAAHGYLLSQFLSPKVNKRTDKWGGPLENRARLLFEVIRGIRAAVSSKFGLGVKINTADFQRGGFAPEEFVEVVKQLSDMKLDLLEVSGGSYEAPVMATGDLGDNATSTQRREAYFLEAAESIKNIGTMPIMVTGGIKKRNTVDEVLGSSDRFIAGMGTALGLVPDLPNRWARGEDPVPKTATSWILRGPLAMASVGSSVQYNMGRIGRGLAVWQNVWPAYALLCTILADMSQTKAYKRWIGERTKVA